MNKVNCAVYVRKSTEKGLELEFNSLHNQEEACKNYILSQSFNGWKYYKTYTDGGISGGTMVRPALQKMLRDINNGNIQIVLVYKIDRLSRSIMDFHNMMVEFDKHNYNLVSITQAFDTSTSMGKLTLNMLLSFAQFEREVSSERVRDKIRASKEKGLWTGGMFPLGYDVIDKKLEINSQEAKHIRKIFEAYLKLGSLNKLRLFTKTEGILSKCWKTKNGKTKGGKELSSNNLNRILRDPIYIGKIRNKTENKIYNGVHQAIVDKKLFNEVQLKLTENYNRGNSSYKKETYLLSNKIYNYKGQIFKNQKSSKNKIKKYKIKKYKYYTLKGFYLPAGDIESITKQVINDFLDSNMKNVPEPIKLAFKQIFYDDKLIEPMIHKIIYHETKLTYFINIESLAYLNKFKKVNFLNIKQNNMENVYLSDDKKFIIIEKTIFISKGIATNRYNGGETSILTKTENAHNLIKALSYAWRYKKMYENGISVKDIAKSEKITKRTVYKYLNLACLSPRIINDVMESKIPTHINLQNLFKLSSAYQNFKQQEQAFYDN